MSGEGYLAVRATLQGRRLVDWELRLERPPLTRLFLGQPPDLVSRRVVGLYSLCAQAQGAAAQAAMAAAQGQPVGLVDAGAAWAEVLHEHLWRLLLDWPVTLDLPPARDAFAAWRKLRLGDQAPAATRRVLTDTLAPLAQRCLARLPPDDAAPAECMGLEPQPWLAHCGGGPRPTWASPQSITQAYAARVRGAYAAADAAARGAAYPLASAAAQGWGVAQTLTARGPLTHAVRMDGGRVQDYRIWAPTDLVFADATALAALLAGAAIDSPAQARQALTHAVLALDPCLPFDMEIKHA